MTSSSTAKVPPTRLPQTMRPTPGLEKIRSIKRKPSRLRGLPSLAASILAASAAMRALRFSIPSPWRAEIPTTPAIACAPKIVEALRRESCFTSSLRSRDTLSIFVTATISLAIPVALSTRAWFSLCSIHPSSAATTRSARSRDQAPATILRM